MQEKVEILESVGQMVLAAHRTAAGSGLTAVTVEAVTLDPPNSTDEVPWVYQDDLAGREA
jgi:hypothetical protein